LILFGFAIVFFFFFRDPFHDWDQEICLDVLGLYLCTWAFVTREVMIPNLPGIGATADSNITLISYDVPILHQSHSYSATLYQCGALNGFCAESVRLERGEGEQNQVFVLNDVSGNLAHAHIHSGLMNLI
jgi:hypothetical protein